MISGGRSGFLRRGLVGALVVLALAAAVSWAAIGSASGAFSSNTTNGPSSFSASPCFAPVAVTIVDNEFTPASVTVAAGCSVKWTNTGAKRHSTTSDTWDSGLLDTGGTFTRVFETPGTFDYRCSLHGAAMAATITVT